MERTGGAILCKTSGFGSIKLYRQSILNVNLARTMKIAWSEKAKQTIFKALWER